MGLTRWISAAAAARVHVLIVEVPGSPVLRMRAEAAVVRRGWAVADVPADADVLLVCGKPDSRVSERVDAVWAQLPGPRHRAMVDDAAGLSAALDAMPAALTDLRSQHADARGRSQVVETAAPQDAMSAEDGSADHGSMEHKSAGHGSMDRGSAEHGSMEHDAHDDRPMNDAAGQDSHDMHMMDMAGPAGIPLASGDDRDRDGLEMDVTHLTLGPILPDWPASLVVHATLSGDVVVAAEPEWLDPAATGAVEPLPAAVGLLDDAARLISVAGWEPTAALVRRIRDDLLDSDPLDEAPARLARLTVRVARSRTLRWSLAGIPPVGDVDSRDRLLGWLHGAAELVGGGAAPAGADGRWTLADLRDAIVGQELATVRLIVASAGAAGIRASTEVPHD